MGRQPPPIVIASSSPVAPPAAETPTRLLASWAKLRADWLRAVATPATQATYAASLDRAVRVIHQVTGWPVPVGPLSPGQAQQIYDRLADTYSVAAANLSRAACASLYRHARALGLPAPAVWEHVRMRPQKDTLGERMLTEAEVRALLAAAEPGLPWCAILWAYLTGQRASEIVTVRGRDLRQDDRGWIVTTYGKGGKTRWIRLPARLVRALAAVRGWPPDPGERLFPVSRQTLWRWVKAAAARAALTDRVSPHWLRHAHASHALDHGVPIHVVQQALGHYSLRITERYLHVSPGAGTADAIPWPGPDDAAP